MNFERSEASTTEMMQVEQQRLSNLSKKQREVLPEIGSFDLIKDLVRDYTNLTKIQKIKREKHDNDSLRAFAGT